MNARVYTHYGPAGSADADYLAEYRALCTDERTEALAESLRFVNEAPLVRALKEHVGWYADSWALGDRVAATRSLDQVKELVRRLEEARK